MSTTNLLDFALKSIFVTPQDKNVGTNERIISCLSGMIMCYTGMKNFKKGGCFLLFPAGFLLFRSATGYCPINKALGRDTTERNGIFTFTRDLMIKKSRADVYQFCKALENFPAMMKHIQKVEKTGDNSYLWTAAFGDQLVEWNAEIQEDIPDKRIIWRSVPPSDVENYGIIEFSDNPEGLGTEMRIIFMYKPEKTAIGKIVAKLINSSFERMIIHDLEEFKQYMENDVPGEG